MKTSVAAIFGKELLASLDKDEVFYWTENIQDIHNSKFTFNCKLASDVIKSPQRILNKLSNVAIVNNKDEGYENHKYLKPGQAIVDLDGNLWRWDGLFISSSYESNISSILAELKEKRLNDLKKQIIEWERILEITNQKIHES